MRARLLDLALEGPIVGSFSRIGYDVRRATDSWTSLDDYDLSGRTMVITGATSGLGRAAAEQLARCGARLLVTGRTEDRTRDAAAAIADAAERDHDAVIPVAADMGDLEQVRALADRIRSDVDRLDVVVHNAGALSAERREAPDGTEATVASQVVGPFLLTSLLLDRLSAAAPSRVLTMSSGGMYGAPLSVASLEMSPETYNGTQQYALAKRAQVTLNEMWAERCGNLGVRFHSLHPGWAATPGVADALPGFAKVVGPILRTPEQGADTLVWLAADDGEPLDTNGRFWGDRRSRSLHRTPMSRRSDTLERRTRLWRWVVERAGIDPLA
ncbi:MAG: SDR family NAD(P)-dependent oxidoreductase [Actinomycetota bacterium]